MIKERFNSNVLRLKYFYDLFAKRKRLFPTFYFPFPIKTRKKKLLVKWDLYKRTVETYLDIYFREFYYNDTPKYFPLSGKLVKAKGKKFTLNEKPNIHHDKRGIVWIWYNRPSLAYFSNIRLLKLKGSGRKISKLDENYRINNDVEVLESHHVTLRNMKHANILFK